MAVVFQEDAKSRGFTVTQDGTKLTRIFVCYGSSDELEIYNAARADLPTFFDGLIRTAIGPCEMFGGRFARLTVEYASGRAGGSGANSETPAGEAPGELPPSAGLGADDPMPQSITFSTTGGTAHITQSISTTHKIRAVSAGGGAAPNNANAIGLRRDGVDGCDVVAPKMEFTWQHQVANVTFAMMRALMKATAKTNDRIWKGFQIGELLYLGAEGQSGERALWTITHRFAFNENLAAEVIARDGAGAADITLPTKAGWEYVWCAYQDTITGDQLYPKPIAAYVEKVYRDTNFALIGLGA